MANESCMDPPSLFNNHHVPDLTEEEKIQLAAVLKKAKEFEEEDLERNSPIEGQLWKYTNVVKGYQIRWFILTPETGMLEYYMMEESKKHRPKGGLYLSNAVVSLSDEDSYSFTISTYAGETYKLKAADSAERNQWISKLQTTVQQHTGSPLEVPANKVQRSPSQSSRDVQYSEQSPKSANVDSKQAPIWSSSDGINFQNPLVPIRQYVESVTMSCKEISSSIEQLPIDGPHLKCYDSELLLLKATCLATAQSLQCCYLILKKRED